MLIFCTGKIISSKKLSKRYRVNTSFTVERELVDEFKYLELIEEVVDGK